MLKKKKKVHRLGERPKGRRRGKVWEVQVRPPRSWSDDIRLFPVAQLSAPFFGMVVVVVGGRRGLLCAHVVFVFNTL